MSPSRRAARASVRLDLLFMLALFALAIIPRAAWVAYNDRAPQGLNDPMLLRALRRPHRRRRRVHASDGREVRVLPRRAIRRRWRGLKKARRHLRLGAQHFSIKMMNGMFGAITVGAAVPAGAPHLRSANGGRRGSAARRLSQPGLLHAARCSRSRCSRCCGSAALHGACSGSRGRATACRGSSCSAPGVLLSYATMTRGITLVFPVVLLAVWLVPAALEEARADAGADRLGGHRRADRAVVDPQHAGVRSAHGAIDESSATTCASATTWARRARSRCRASASRTTPARRRSRWSWTGTGRACGSRSRTSRRTRSACRSSWRRRRTGCCTRTTTASGRRSRTATTTSSRTSGARCSRSPRTRLLRDGARRGRWGCSRSRWRRTCGG